MNVANIQTTINILKRAQSLDMTIFQKTTRFRQDGRPIYAKAEEELHACGNTACIAGYIAVSPEWAAIGGFMQGAAPILPNIPKSKYFDDTTVSMASFWGVSLPTAAAIIYGDRWYSFCDDSGLKNLPEHWADITKPDAIALFQEMLALPEEQAAQL